MRKQVLEWRVVEVSLISLWHFQVSFRQVILGTRNSNRNYESRWPTQPPRAVLCRYTLPLRRIHMKKAHAWRRVISDKKIMLRLPCTASRNFQKWRPKEIHIHAGGSRIMGAIFVLLFLLISSGVWWKMLKNNWRWLSKKHNQISTDSSVWN